MYVVVVCCEAARATKVAKSRTLKETAEIGGVMPETEERTICARLSSCIPFGGV